MIPKLTADVRKKIASVAKNEKKSRISTDLNFKFFKKAESFWDSKSKNRSKDFRIFCDEVKNFFPFKNQFDSGFNLSDLSS